MVAVGGDYWYTLTSLSEIVSSSSTGSYRVFDTKQATNTGTPQPTAITLGPDGNLWYADYSGAIGRMTPSGVDREFSLDTSTSVRYVNSITSGPDGNLWFTTYDCKADRIGRITTTGKVTLYPLHTKCNEPTGITTGPDGNLWFTELQNRVGRITPEGKVDTFAAPSSNLYPQNIITGPDGNLWIADTAYNGIVSVVSPSGHFLKQFTDPHQSAAVYNLTVGSDGNVWASESGVLPDGVTFTSGLARITPSGIWTDYRLPDSDEIPYGITAGATNQIWFTIYGRAGKPVKDGIGYLTI